MKTLKSNINRKRNNNQMNDQHDVMASDILEPNNKKNKFIEENLLISQSENRSIQLDFKQTSSNFSSILIKNSQLIPTHNGNPCGRKIEIKNFTGSYILINILKYHVNDSLYNMLLSCNNIDIFITSDLYLLNIFFC